VDFNPTGQPCRFLRQSRSLADTPSSAPLRIHNCGTSQSTSNVQRACCTPCRPAERLVIEQGIDAKGPSNMQHRLSSSTNITILALALLPATRPQMQYVDRRVKCSVPPSPHETRSRTALAYALSLCHSIPWSRARLRTVHHYLSCSSLLAP